MFSAAAWVLSDCSPVWAMTETMPTGPDISSMDTQPDTRSWRLMRTMRTKSNAVYQLFLRTVPRVFPSVPKYRP